MKEYFIISIKYVNMKKSAFRENSSKRCIDKLTSCFLW